MSLFHQAAKSSESGESGIIRNHFLSKLSCLLAGSVNTRHGCKRTLGLLRAGPTRFSCSGGQRVRSADWATKCVECQYQPISTIKRQSFKYHLDNSKSVHGRLMLAASCGIGRMVFELWSMVFAKLKRTRLRATCWMSALGRVLLCGASTVFLMS